MATITQSGYLASAASLTFSGTQTLASLTDNEYTDLSDEVDNSTNKYLFADFYFDLGSITPVGVDCGVEVYVVPSVDDTNYPTWTGNVTSDESENALFYVGFVPLNVATAAQKGILRNVQLPPGKWKVGVRNRAGVGLAASGNTMYWRPHSFSI